MKKRTVYTDEPMDGKVIDDFLPPPSALVFNDEKVKITISLSKKSVEFFKNEAKKHNTNYQKMIRNLLDIYVQKVNT